MLEHGIARHDVQDGESAGRRRIVDCSGELEDLDHELIAPRGLVPLARAVGEQFPPAGVALRRGVLDDIERLLDMQLASSAPLVHAVPVVHAVRDVRGLLYLGEHYAGADGVDHAPRNHDDVAGLRLERVQDRIEFAVLDSLGELFPGGARVYAADQLRVRIGVYDVPRLFLAGALLVRACVVVAGMDLDRQRLVRVDVLDEQGKPAVLEDGFVTDDFGRPLLDQRAERCAGERAGRDARLEAGIVGYLPRLADLGVGREVLAQEVREA